MRGPARAALGLALFGVAGAGAVAADTFRYDVSVDERYDDNILQLSDRDIERVERGVPSTRFRITTPDDFVTSFGGRAEWTVRPFPHRSSVFSIDADLDRYARNPVKNYEQYGAAYFQELSASRKHLTSLRVFAQYTPSFYLRELTDDDASFAAGARIRASADYSAIDYGMRLEQEVVEDRMTISARWDLESRDYNHHFDERDGDKNTWSLAAHGRPWARSRAQLSLAFETGALDARGDLASSPIPDDDISYDHRSITVGAAIPWTAGPGGRVEISAGRETRDFTTSNRFDTTRYGRTDHRDEFRVRLVQHLAKGFEFIADVWRYSNTAAFPGGVPPSDDVTDFTQNRYTFGLRYRDRAGARIGTAG